VNRWFLVFLLALGLLPPDASAASPRPGAVDAGDFFLTPKSSRPLWRVAGMVALRAETGADGQALARQLIARGGPIQGYSLGQDVGHGYQLLAAPEAERIRLDSEPGRLDAVLAAVRAQPGVSSFNPVFVDPDSGLKGLVTPDMIIRLKPGVEADAYFGADRDRVRPLRHTTDQFLLTLPITGAEDVLREINRHAGDPRVEWAQPDFLGEVRRAFTPSDPLFTNQWHLGNTGQNGAKPDADVDAPEAWDITTGSNSIVIAIIDDGVEWEHPDIIDNLFANEPEGIPGVDGDGNGYTNDLHGWDFVNDNNDSGPKDADDQHGMCCAGVAASAGNNGLGVAGIAYGCNILPIKVIHGTNWVTPSAMASAIRYSAGLDVDGTNRWRGADVISMSLGFTALPVTDAAFDDAVTKGRGGKGTPVLASSGNNASGHSYFTRNPSGTNGTPCYIEFWYRKNDSVTNGEDAVWVSSVKLPDAGGTWERFDSPDLPAGWSVTGDVPFSIVDDPSHAYGSGRYAARSGAIGDSQGSCLRTPAFYTDRDKALEFQAWVSSEKTKDWLTVEWHYLNTGNTNIEYITSGIPGDRMWLPGDHEIDYYIHYPASHSNVIAVGASTDFDYRSDYSQYGTGLEFVVPSSGGHLSPLEDTHQIVTIDRTSTNGYNTAEGSDGDYTATFGGTSAACPLAAGIAALILSTDTNLTWQEVRDRMRASCERIGPVPYDENGWNEYYGYGRLNAWAAVAGIPWDLVLTNPVVTDTRTYRAFNTITAFDQFRVQSPGDVTLNAGNKITLGPGFQAVSGAVFRTRLGEVTP